MPLSRVHKPLAAIAGCGALTAVGRGVESLRVALRNNSTGLRPLERFANPRFQTSIVGAVPLDAPLEDPHDPAWAFATDALQEARDQALPALANIPAERIGLVFSTTKANIEALERLSDGQPCSERARRHLQPDLLAADLAASHGARGPVQCVSVACASGLVALQQGAKWLERGAADAVFVVGVDHLSAFVVAGFSALKALDPAGCRPFDRNRAGLSPGEAGAAIVLVKSGSIPASQSNPTITTIRGWSTSNDANHLTGPSRDGSGLALAIRRALERAGLEPAQIDYVNAHGTGTPYNDAMESQALRTIFNGSCPPVSGSKGMLGHTLGAAGIVETILCTLAIKEALLPGTPRLNAPAEEAPDTLLNAPRAVSRLKHILKVNTGFGGINAALVLSA